MPHLNNMQPLCNMCPRNCNVSRNNEDFGFCNSGREIEISYVGKHLWEEPCISGKNGSGTIFFTGCNMRCVYCQNDKISRNQRGTTVTPAQLSDIILQLQSENVHNINLVTPSHFSVQIAEALKKAKKKRLSIPVIYNTSSYETIDSLRQMEGLVDVYLPDIKYINDSNAIKYSSAFQYFYHASNAVKEMYRQTGDCVFDSSSIIQKGTIIRILVLPNMRKECFEILDWIAENLPKSVYISIMSQYTPLGDALIYKELNRKITSYEYDSVIDYFFKRGFRNGFMQGRASATTAYVPDF